MTSLLRGFCIVEVHKVIEMANEMIIGKIVVVSYLSQPFNVVHIAIY
jgi:hypothetical protein